MNKSYRVLWAGAAALTLGLTSACSNGDGGDGGGESMVFIGQGGAYQEAQNIAFIEPFVADSGVDVSQSSPASMAQMMAMVDAGNTNWDVMEAYNIRALQHCGTYLEEIDWDIVGRENVEEDLIMDCGVPNMKSALLLVYNTETYGGNPPTGWVDFFDTDAFPGTRGIMSGPLQGGIEAALLADGVTNEDLYPFDYDRAFAKLDTLGDDLTILATGADQEQAFQNETVDMMLAWPGRAADAVSKGAPYAPVWDQAIFYNDVFVVPKDAPNKDVVMEFLAWVVTPEAQATLAENIAYAPINPEAEPDLDETARSFMPFGQDDGSGIVRDTQWWADNETDATERWTNWEATQ